MHATNDVIKASLRPYVLVPNVFPKQHHLLSGELVFPAVLVSPYTLLKELKRWQGEIQLRGENPVLRSPGNVSTVFLRPRRAHSPADTQRGWSYRIHGCDRITSAHIYFENCCSESKTLFLELDIYLIRDHRITDIGKDL